MNPRLALLCLALVLPSPLAGAEPRRWFPLQLDLSAGYTGGRVPSGVLGLYAGAAGGGPISRFGGLYFGAGAEGTLETLARLERHGSLGLQLRLGWAWGGEDDGQPAVPRTTLYLRATPMLTGVPLSAATQQTRLALESGPFPGLRLGAGVTSISWSGVCFDAWLSPSSTSSEGEELLSWLWCLLDHAEGYVETYGRTGSVQTRWGFRLGGGF